jgi:putative ABC transport system permease protein
MIAQLFASLRGLLRRRRIDGEIAEELRDHLEREIAAHRLRGVSPEEARRLALRDLGGLTQTIESTREVRATWLDTVWRDLRYGARLLRRSPRFTVTALTVLVLGIGSTTAIFSIAYAVLVRPLPYADAERLVFLAEQQGAGIAWPNFDDWRQRATSFDGIAISLADAVIVTSGQLPQRFDSRSVTVNFFGVLGVAPFQGRLFDQSDARPDAALTAVVSHEFAMREFGSAPAAIGQTVSMRRPYTVIGVLPPGFRYMTASDVYLLLEPQVAENYRGMQSRGTHTGLYAVGRLKPGVDVTSARAEMQNIVAALALEYPLTNKGSGVSVVALSDRVVRDMAPTLTVLAGAVALLLLIACVNLASLLLNRSASRAHEFGVRTAIGGSRWSLIRQLLIEHALLVGAGGVLGALAGAVILTGLVRVAPPDTPRLDEIRLDLVVLSCTTLFSCACAFLFGVLPAVRASGAGGPEAMVRSGRGSTRQNSLLRRSLLIGEVAVATVLLSGSGLMVHTMLRLSRVDPGFDPHNLQTVMFSLAGPTWPDPRKQAFFAEAVERLRAVPGVENAAITYSLPILGSNWWNWFTVAGRPVPPGAVMMDLPSAGIVPVSATYFETLKIPLIRGRSFDRSDTPESQPVAIINTSLVNLYWRNRGGPATASGPAFINADEDPIGQRIRLAGGSPTNGYGPWRTIVGIVGDVKQHGVDQDTPQQIFLPVVQQTRTTVFAVARTRGTVSSAAIETAIRDLDRSVPVFNDRTVEQVMREAASRRRVAAIVLSVFAGAAVLLAAIGLYGVIAQSVGERRQEIGVRMALGATGGQILRLFLRYGLIVVAVGIACGVFAAMAAARSLASLVFGVTVTDPATLGAVAAVLTFVTLLACYMSARSATRVDPLEALRSE